MSGTGAGAYATANASAVAHANAFVEALATATADAHAVAEIMIDLGIAHKYHGPCECTRCGHVMDSNASGCPRCGAILGETIQDHPESFSINEDDDEEPVHGKYGDDQEPVVMDVDLHTRFEELLLSLGWPENIAEEDALAITWVWENTQNSHCNIEELLQNSGLRGKEFLNRKDVIHKIMDEFRVLDEEVAQKPQPPKKVLLTIRLDDNGKWKVEVHDPFLNLIFDQPNSLIDLPNGFRIRAQKLREAHEKKVEKLQHVGDILISHHNKFLDSVSKEEADKARTGISLTQKETAKAIDVPYSSFNRWCRQEWVATPHGDYRLLDFFKKSSSLKIKAQETFSVEGATVWVKKILAGYKREFGEKKVTSTKFGQYILETFGIMLNERTLRSYIEGGRKKDKKIP
jgi:hypothetical protein